MNNKLRAYMDELFSDAPVNRKTVELKEEMLRNLTDKYNDLITEGKTEEAAYNIAVASVGDISSLLEELNRDKNTLSSYDNTPEKRKHALLTAISVSLYILAIIPIFILQDERGLIAMFAIAAVATAIIIYSSMTKPRYEKLDETLVEDFKAWKAQSTESNELYKAINSLLWTATTVIYIVVSFKTGAWHITWLIFLIASAVGAVIKAVFDLLKKK